MFDFVNTETSALMERRTAIVEECNSASGEALDALEAELDAINAELENRKADEKRRQAIRDTVAAGAGVVVAEIKEERKDTPMTLEEIRSSKAYMDAYANYIKTGKDDECRALLTENAGGSVPTPTIVEEIIRTAWESNEFLARVHRTYVRGNLKVPFELSAEDAVVHSEGTSAVSEENLTFGMVTLLPKNIKKLVRISDEALAMGGEEFLRYVYDEVAYRVALKAAKEGVADITGASTSADSTHVAVAKITAAPAVTTVAVAATRLTEEARNLCVVLNRLSEEDFIEAHAAGNFSVDPFNGLPRVYTSALPAYSTASANAVYAIVGDLDALQYNFPEGDDVRLKFDDLTEADRDIVRVIGRIYTGHGVTGPGRLCNIAKPAAVTT